MSKGVNSGLLRRGTWESPQRQSAMQFVLPAREKSVIIIQFLKGKNENELAFLTRLEPENQKYSGLQNPMRALMLFRRAPSRKRL